MLMMTLPTGIILSFGFATIVAAMVTYFYILHLKEDFKKTLYFQKLHYTACTNSLKQDNKELNNTVKSLSDSNKLLKTKNKILSMKYSKNKKKHCFKNK